MSQVVSKRHSCSCQAVHGANFCWVMQPAEDSGYKQGPSFRASIRHADIVRSPGRGSVVQAVWGAVRAHVQNKLFLQHEHVPTPIKIE